VNLPTLAAVAILVIFALGLGFLLGSRIGISRVPSWLDGAVSSTMPNRRAYTLPLNNPDMVPTRDAPYMRDDDVVLGVLFNGQARAYPWWLTSNYHVVNETVGEEPLLITLCEVCGGAAAFRPFVPELPDIPLSFQVCGVGLGTLEMMDFQTHSRWRPFLGCAYEGPLKGRSLENYPVLMMTWKEWRQSYPDSLVVNGSPQLRERPHGAQAGHIGDPGLPYLFERTANLNDKRLGSHELVLGVRLTEAGRSFALPVSRLVPYPQLFRVTLASKPILIVRAGELAMAAFDLGPTPYRSGFEITSKDPLRFRTPDGRTWNAFGVSTDPGLPEKRLPSARSYLTEWYEWVSHSPDSEIVNSVDGSSGK
jgi:hypothetical protein